MTEPRSAEAIRADLAVNRRWRALYGEPDNEATARLADDIEPLLFHVSKLEQANEQLRAKLSRVDALCERWRDKRTTASAGAALRLVLDDTDD